MVKSASDNVIKEGPTRLVVECQNNVLLLWRAILNYRPWCVISMKLNIGEK